MSHNILPTAVGNRSLTCLYYSCDALPTELIYDKPHIRLQFILIQAGNHHTKTYIHHSLMQLEMFLLSLFTVTAMT